MAPLPWTAALQRSPAANIPAHVRGLSKLASRRRLASSPSVTGAQAVWQSDSFRLLLFYTAYKRVRLPELER